VFVVVEVVLVLLLAANLWCLEPPGVTPGDAAAAGSSCSYTFFSLYLLLPPAAAVASPFLLLAAVALQSPTLLRQASSWHVGAMLAASVSLCIAQGGFTVQMGSIGWLIPAALLGLGLVQAQLIPWQVAELEAARPVRGWRGLLEVRSLERLRRQ